MKETVLDVLMYLFENYFDEDAEVGSDRESLARELVLAGFRDPEIGKAFDWLEGLAAEQGEPGTISVHGTQNVRVYTEEEVRRIGLEARSFLLFLEQVGVLDTLTRELVVDRVMALETEEIDLDQLKWVVLMVLFNQPGREAVYAWMEDFVFEQSQGRLH
jgi:Smg protein